MVSIADAGVSLLAGGLTTLSPCVFPLLPLVVGSATARHPVAPVAMAAGLTLSFVLLGGIVGGFGAQIGLDTDGLRPIGGALMMLFGLILGMPVLERAFAQWIAPLANRAAHMGAGRNGTGVGGAFLVGSTLGLVWSPCSGPFLAGTLALAASEGGALTGGGLLALFGIGASLPLLGVAYASRQALTRVRPALMNQSGRLKKGMGGVMLLTGLAVLTGADKRLEAIVLDYLPESWTALTVAF